MDLLLTVAITLAAALLAASVYMECLGLLSAVIRDPGVCHDGCGHHKLTPANNADLCWWCRHRRLARAVHAERRAVS